MSGMTISEAIGDQPEKYCLARGGTGRQRHSRSSW